MFSVLDIKNRTVTIDFAVEDLLRLGVICRAGEAELRGIGDGEALYGSNHPDVGITRQDAYTAGSFALVFAGFFDACAFGAEATVHLCGDERDKMALRALRANELDSDPLWWSIVDRPLWLRPGGRFRALNRDTSASIATDRGGYPHPSIVAAVAFRIRPPKRRARLTITRCG